MTKIRAVDAALASALRRSTLTQEQKDRIMKKRTPAGKPFWRVG